MDCLSADGHHAGGEDAHAPVAGGTDQLKHDTRAEVAEQGECAGVCECACMHASVWVYMCAHVCMSMSMYVYFSV